MGEMFYFNSQWFHTTFLKNYYYPMNKSLLLVLLLLIGFKIFAQQQGLQLHYAFNPDLVTGKVKDETGNGRPAILLGSAALRTLGGFGLVETGASAGYVDMGAEAGSVISGLNDFSVAVYVYVDPVQLVTSAGNFIWSFSNSPNIAADANGCLFFSARESRYAISTTNWRNEQQVSLATAFGKGAWVHVAYVQSGNTGNVYLNGVLQKSGNITLKPSTLGATAYNYLFKSPYATDALLLNSKMTDFRLYNTALNATSVQQLGVHRQRLDTLLFTEIVQNTQIALDQEILNSVRSNIALPTEAAGGVVVSWSSSRPDVLSATGVVTRPQAGAAPVQVTLTATLSKQFVQQTRTFTATVQPFFSDAECVQYDAAAIVIGGNVSEVRSPLSLPASGQEGSVISWTSLNPQMLSSAGVVLNRPAHGQGDAEVILRALIRKNQAETTRDFVVKVAEDEGFAGYLFAYFTGNNIAQEAIRFAISTDGLNYKALNNNQPVISSAAISLTGGVRDPHILRGEDGNFYMVVTDMVSANGWSSNRGMVLLKSANLVDWTSATVHIPTAFAAEFGNVDRVWAPQTIYDPTVGKYMVYFSMRRGSGDYDKIYYAYANASFTALETVPQQLFFHPTGGACIDGDIVFHEGKYHLFFKTEGSGNGIKKAVSENLTSGYVMLDRYLQQTSSGVEGSCVFRLYNTDEWILMYDVYTAGYYQFTRSMDMENFSVIASGAVSMDFSPRHGTVMPLTGEEMMVLRVKWDKTLNTGAVFQDESVAEILGYFDLSGRRLYSFPQQGIYLMKYRNVSGEVRVKKIGR
jgi:hypothetical protein